MGLGWQPHPDAWLLVVAVLGGYLYALAAWGPRFAPGRRPATTRQRLYFFLGVGVLWLGADWPVHTLADRLFSVHMVQHLLFSLVAAPLLILGTPGWLVRRLLQLPGAFRGFQALTHPGIALVLFSGWVAVYHTPAVVNLSVHNDLFHLAAHVVWVGVSVVMWWPVLSPLPELPHLSYPARMGYLFATSILPTVPASFLTFAHGSLYAAYAEQPALWWSAVTDQQIAGLTMKIGGGLILWGVIAVLFFRWFVEEEHGGPDLLYWRDLAPELESADPRDLGARP